MWQPIETAPKDGTEILGYACGKMTTVYWNVDQYDIDLGGYWTLVIPGAWAEDGEWNPTHWQPLPGPPEE